MEALIFTLLCANPYGVFTELNASQRSSLVEVAGRQLSAHYPPAKTHLLVLHRTEFFGASLAQYLRELGYAVTEHSPPANECSQVRRGGRFSRLMRCARTQEKAPSGALSFGFIVDRISEDGLYRLTLIVDQRPMTLAFRWRADAVERFGQWAMMDKGS
ncbi:MAG: hypothetical protein KTR25_14165 [Myxococcales bacterium]|nr:hypothetical protein [Myxococcales bacterium]